MSIKRDVKYNNTPNINDYDEILHAAKLGNLVIFVGAGYSRLISLPSWESFAKDKIYELFDNNLIDFKTKEYLNKLNPKKSLSIYKRFKDSNKEILFKPEKEYFSFKENQDYVELYEPLYDINAIYLTTNYDECLDRMVEKRNDLIDSEMEVLEEDSLYDDKNYSKKKGRIFYRKISLDSANLDVNNVIHLHGSVKDENTMIVSIDDYIQMYGNIDDRSNDEVSTFLKDVFENYTVLFIGYGLEEQEILEYMFTKVKNPLKESKHFMLMPLLEIDNPIVNILNDYYSQFGVSLIPYNISQKGYETLKDIVIEWSKELINVSGPRRIAQKAYFIDSLLTDESKSITIRYSSLMKLMSDDTLKRHFFDKVSNIEWFDLLYQDGFFQVPSDIELDKGTDGRVKYFGPFKYIDKLLNRNNEFDEKYYMCFIDIIDSYTKAAMRNEVIINNYYLWRTGSKLLCKLPDSLVSEKSVKSIRIWLKSNNAIDLIMNDINDCLFDKLYQIDNAECFKLMIDIITDLKQDRTPLVKNAYYLSDIFTLERTKQIHEKSGEGLFKNLSSRLETLIMANRVSKHYEDNNNKYILFFCIERNYKFELFKVIDEDYTWGIEKFKPNMIEGVSSLYLEDHELSNKNLIKINRWLNEYIQDSYNYDDDLISLEKQMYSQETYRALEEKMIEFGEEDIDLFRDILIRYTPHVLKTNADAIADVIINTKFKLLTKICLFAIGLDMKNGNSIIWRILESSKGYEIFSDSSYGYELKLVLEKIEVQNSDNMSLLKEMINNPPRLIGSEKDKQYQDYWKLRRLKALSHIKHFNDMYNKINQSYNLDLELSAVITEGTGGWYEEKSPITLEELQTYSNDQIIEYIDSFVYDNNYNSPTYSGLGNVLSQYAEQNAYKVSSEFEKYIYSKYMYIDMIIEGLLRSKEEVNLSTLINALSKLIRSKEFWENTNSLSTEGFNYNNTVVLNSINRLVRTFFNKDEHLVDKEVYLITESIISESLSNLSSTVEKNPYNDMITYLINSQKGKLYESLLILVLHTKRFDESDINPVNLLRIVTEDVKAGVLEALLSFGYYFRNYHYIMGAEVTSIISRLSSQDDWEYFMTGYFQLVELSKDIVDLMVPQYRRSVITPFANNELYERLANHLWVIFTNDDSMEVNEIFELFLSSLKKEYIDVFTERLSRNVENKTELKRSRVLKFVLVAMEKIESEYSKHDEKEKIYKKLCYLVKHFDGIELEVLEVLKKLYFVKMQRYQRITIFKELYRIYHTNKESLENISILSEVIASNMFDDYKDEYFAYLLNEMAVSDSEIIKEHLMNISDILTVNQVHAYDDICEKVFE